MKDALCKAFCDAITVREVPAGLVIGTPLVRGSEKLAIYVVYDRTDRGLARLEDDTLTITYLDAAGIDLFEEPRSNAFAELMRDSGVFFDAESGVLHTNFVPITEIPSLALAFAVFLVRMQDFMLLTRERVEATFKSDVIQAVMSRFSGRATVSINAPPLPDLQNYVADAVIQSPLHPPLALYIGRTENKALEALVLRQAAQIEHSDCHIMLVVPTNKASKVKEKTRARLDDKFPIVPFIGSEAAALSKMERVAFGQDATVH